MTVTINGTTGIANDGGYTGDGVVFADTTPANTLVTTTGGNVGIGTSSPNALFKLDVYGQTRISSAGAQGLEVQPGALTYVLAYNRGTSSYVPLDVAGEYVRFSTGNGSERARIDSSGNLLVGTTSASCGGVDMRQHISASDFCFGLTATGGGASRQVARFSYSTTAVGSITVGASSTSYNTSSDYRLKENIAPMTGALAKVAALNPVTYTWKADGSDGQGFIAHELQEVCPDAVVGEKDAVDADGNPQYQGIDTSFLVATLTAAIQELKAINDAQAETITALTARVTALEGA